MFIDKVKIKLISGSGGNGIVAWRKEKFVPKGGPAGGDGGKGGDVYIIAGENLSTLLDFKYKSKFMAENGENGRNKNQHGKNGSDIFIKVPCGTIIRDLNSKKIIGDLVLDGQKVLVASGGRGGRGNSNFATSTRRTPQFCEPGEPGIERDLELELKLIADIGLLGLPNAGKSTLISVISAAAPKIADYPFTTLSPNLGVIKKPDGDGIVVADIPGLIEGASHGAGLGLEFLRHIERTRLLLHLLDTTEQDPVKNHEIINQELKNYGGRLADIPQIIVLNKIDAAESSKINFIKETFEKENNEVFAISAVTRQGVQELVNYLIKKMQEIPLPKFEIEVEEDHVAYDHDDSDFIIYKDKKAFTISGGRIERLVSVTDLKNTEAVFRLHNILTSMGVSKALKDSGIKDGDLVKIANYEFEYYSDRLGEFNDER
ncbi:MAG: GTPase ObgE [bacterium]